MPAAEPPSEYGRPDPAALARLPYETPFLVLDLDEVTRSYRAFTELLPGVDVHYAMKCNPDRRVLARLHGLGSGFEVASVAELRELVDIGVDPRDVLYSNPVKPAAQIREAWRRGVWRFAFDSTAELEKLSEHAPEAAIYVRLRTAAAGNAVPSEGKFGVDGRHAAALLRHARGLGLAPYGIAFHVGSQMTSTDPFEAAIERSAAVLRILAEDGIRLEMLDLGGGFPAQYDGESVPPLDSFADTIRESVRRHLPYAVGLVVEPGRALVAEAGVMVATVIGVADRAGQRWAHLDVGSFNGFMEALETGNRLRFPVADSRRGPRTARYHLTGPTCDSQDTILFDAELSADLAMDDKVVLYTSGAYTTTYASTFNGFAIPATRILADR